MYGLLLTIFLLLSTFRTLLGNWALFQWFSPLLFAPGVHQGIHRANLERCLSCFISKFRPFCYMFFHTKLFWLLVWAALLLLWLSYPDKSNLVAFSSKFFSQSLSYQTFNFETASTYYFLDSYYSPVYGPMNDSMMNFQPLSVTSLFYP